MITLVEDCFLIVFQRFDTVRWTTEMHPICTKLLQQSPYLLPWKSSVTCINYTEVGRLSKTKRR